MRQTLWVENVIKNSNIEKLSKYNKKLLSPDEVFVKLKEYFSGDRKLIFILTFLAYAPLIEKLDGNIYVSHSQKGNVFSLNVAKGP